MTDLDSDKKKKKKTLGFGVSQKLGYKLSVKSFVENIYELLGPHKGLFI